jgi:hypothetical protein
MSVMVIFLHFFDYIRVSSADTNKALCGKILAKTMTKSWQKPCQNLAISWEKSWEKSWHYLGKHLWKNLGNGKKHGKIFTNILAKPWQNVGKIYAKSL